MSDFSQNGIISNLHDFGTKSTKEIEIELKKFSKDSQKLRKLNVIVILKFLIASLKTLDYKRIIQH